MMRRVRSIIVNDFVIIITRMIASIQKENLLDEIQRSRSIGVCDLILSYPRVSKGVFFRQVDSNSRSRHIFRFHSQLE